MNEEPGKRQREKVERVVFVVRAKRRKGRQRGALSRKGLLKSL